MIKGLLAEELEEIKELAPILRKIGVKKAWRTAEMIILGEFSPAFLKGYFKKPGVTILRRRADIHEIEEWVYAPQGAYLIYYSYDEDFPYIDEVGVEVIPH